ncbi:hypothetical protein [Oscillibacter sp.]|uniref:hypothetical protein n=1 Tax=Oscillibacter sp. TaxID=1945593 RepID=UPI0028983B8D|nr:hypothetical protein [Oscillibacter sp.]
MTHENWDGVFPGAPQDFHRAVEQALSECTPARTERRFPMKRKALFIAAAAVAALCVTAAAAYVFKWNEAMARRFGADPKQQELLSSAGAVGAPEQSVTENGLTVSALQTLGDKNGVYLLLSVKAPDGTALTDASGFEMLGVNLEGSDHVSWSGGFMSGPAQTASLSGAENERYFELRLYNTQQADWNSKTITLDFANLQADRGKLNMYTVTEGEWALSWPLTYTDAMQSFTFGETYQVNGHAVTVDSVQLSPLSLALSLSGDGLEALIENSDLNEAGSLCTVSLTMEDGTVLDELYGPGTERYADALYGRTTSFDQIVDADRAAALTLTFFWESGNNTITIPLD